MQWDMELQWHHLSLLAAILSAFSPAVTRSEVSEAKSERPAGTRTKVTALLAVEMLGMPESPTGGLVIDCPGPPNPGGGQQAPGQGQALWL